MKYSSKQITINFESESQTSVSWETLNAMKAIVGVHSLEALILKALVRLKNDLEVAYPIDDGHPTAQNFAAIARLAPQDMKLKVLSSLFEDDAAEQESEVNEYNLVDMVSQITDENMHNHINFSNSLDPKISDEKTHVSDFYDIPYPNRESEVFTIEVSLMSTEQLQALWRKQIQAIDNGQVLSVTRRLSFEDWDDLLAIFSDKGKAMVEELRIS